MYYFWVFFLHFWLFNAIYLQTLGSISKTAIRENRRLNTKCYQINTAESVAFQLEDRQKTIWVARNLHCQEKMIKWLLAKCLIKRSTVPWSVRGIVPNPENSSLKRSRAALVWRGWVGMWQSAKDAFCESQIAQWAAKESLSKRNCALNAAACWGVTALLPWKLLEHLFSGGALCIALQKTSPG